MHRLQPSVFRTVRSVRAYAGLLSVVSLLATVLAGSAAWKWG
jgi:hypothetical protein